MTDAENLSQAQSDARTQDSALPQLPLPPALLACPRSALFLDFDGTLVEIAERPDAVDVAAGLPRLIAGLAQKLEGRLAIVSGRTLAALDDLLGPVEIAMAGSHGGEFRADHGADVLSLADPLPGEVVDALLTFAQANGGLLVEPKPFSAAIHYRHHPHALDPLLAETARIAAAHGLGVKHGKQVIELTMPGSDKGSAVTRFMELPVFAHAQPIFIGDDVTDEDAFDVVSGFGGTGILVGDPRPTAATFRLPDVEAVHRWLSAALKGEEEA